MIERAVSEVHKTLSDDSTYDTTNWTIDERAHNKNVIHGVTKKSLASES